MSLIIYMQEKGCDSVKFSHYNDRPNVKTTPRFRENSLLGKNGKWNKCTS